ncbi:alpha/beta hydrolase-fold protein [Rasiella sp. SM2506]|uniref:alpha/beta hydrolase-fold protein n=1 Tax=Rasiella sp. SM2506 TaxID=3423914 RepID=UPI003D78E6C8
MKMFKIIVFINTLCFFTQSHAQYTQNTEKQLVIGTVDSLYSETLKEQREIWIQLPEDFNEAERYPVIYVLDAKQHFYAVTGMMKRLVPWQLPKSIVVGITNTDRTRDFTPTHVPFQRGQESKTSGGANNFLTFMESELKPFIRNTYPTEDNHTIIGHSTGGLFVLYSYLNHQDVFDNFLAIDPSLWWDKEKLVQETQQLLENGNRKEKSLYVAVANSLGKGLDTVNVRKDKSVSSEQMRANLKFHDILDKNKEQLTFTWEYFKDEDHGSITIPAQYNGLRAVFSWFVFPEVWRFNTPKQYSAKELTDPYYTHYKKLSSRMKRDVKPDWELVNDVGGHLLNDRKLSKRALAFFEMNVHFYPDQSRSYVALGTYYLSQKKKAEAIEYYTKAIKLDGNEEAKVKLEQLKK